MNWWQLLFGALYIAAAILVVGIAVVDACCEELARMEFPERPRTVPTSTGVWIALVTAVALGFAGARMLGP